MSSLRLLTVLLLALTAVACLAEDDGPAASGPPVVIPAPPPVRRILDKDVAAWIAHLKKYENEHERKLAMFCLIDFGPAAAEAVPELIALCKDELQPDTQRWAAETLGAIGPGAKDAIPDLLATLNDLARPAAHRATACASLARIDPESASVRKAVLNAFRDAKDEVRAAAIDAAVTLAPFDRAALAALAKALASPADAPAAATALRCLGEAGIEPLKQAVEKGEGVTRVAAAEALSRMDGAAAALPTLLKALKRERAASTRRALLQAAVRIAPADPAVLQALAEQLGARPADDRPAGKPDPREPPPDMETRALTAAGEAAVPALRTALRSRDAAARLHAVAVLARLAAPTEGVVDDVLARAQDKEKDVRLAAVKALDGFGPAAAKTHDALLELAKQDASLKRAAELAALNVAREPQKPRHRSILETRPCAEAIAALKDADPAVRQEAAEALRVRTEDPSGAANALIETLADKEPQVRAAAARSLALYGKYARVAMSTFAEWIEGVAKQDRVFNDETPPEEKRAFYAEAKAALVALAGMGAEAKPALPAVARLALSPHAGQDADLRELLGTVLRIIGPDAVPSLAAGLKDPNEIARAAAARALASMGAVAATGVPALIELCKSAVDSDAQAGFAALQAIGPASYGMAAPYMVTVIHGDLFADRRKWAAWALGGIRVPESGDTAKVIDALMLALLDTDDGVCRGAHAALARIGAPALPRLRDMLKLGEGEAPYWAVRVLARMKADPADVIPPLAELTLPGRRPVERGTAAELLGEYAPAHTEIIPVLMRLMGDREDYVARIAARALVPFGEKVVEPLRKLLQDRNPLVRHRALDALETIHAALEAKPAAP